MRDCTNLHLHKQNETAHFSTLCQNWVLSSLIFSLQTLIRSEISLISKRSCSRHHCGMCVFLRKLESDAGMILTYLYKQDRKDAYLISQLAFCPVLIHSADHSDDVILKERESLGSAFALSFQVVKAFCGDQLGV